MSDTTEKQQELEKSALFEEQFRRETQRLTVSRTRYALYAAIVIYPGFWLLDRLVAPDFQTFFFWIRMVVVGGYLVGLATLLRPVRYNTARVISVGVVFISALGIALMIPYLGGFSTSYYIGILMALVVAGLFMPWDVPSTVICGLLILASYFGLNFVYGYGSTSSLTAIMQPMFFLGGTFVFIIWANREKELSRRNDLLMRMQLESANEDLKALDETKTRFFSNVSHELRSPLMLILGPTETLLQNNPSAEDREMLAAVESNARRLLRQVNSLLDFAKMDAGKLKCQYDNGNLGEELVSLVAAAKPMAEKRGIKLSIVGHENVPDALMDYQKMETVAANLISNALKFTPIGGSITVTAGCNKEFVFFEVADTGAGMPKDQLHNIFERFLQIDSALSRKTSGTGLGLAMVKELTELQHGHVLVDSELGKGTTFRIEVPRYPKLDAVDRRQAVGRRRVDKLAAKRTTSMLGMYYEEKNSKKTLLSDVDAAKLEMQARTGEYVAASTAPLDADKILLVEDNDDLRTFVARQLSKNYRVVTASDGLKGLESAKRERPDLIITDVMMPNMDGYTMCANLRKDKAFDNVPVILATAEWGTDKLVKGVDVGANDYISKPYELRELEARIKAHLRVSKLEFSLAERDKRLSAIGKMTSSIVHDLRNPLNSILGFTQLAREVSQTRQGDELVQYLDPVIEESKRLGLMIAEVLDFAKGRITYLSLELTSLKAFLEEIGETHRERLARYNVELTIIHGAPEDILVQLDRQRMRRVIENLIKNAQEAIYEQNESSRGHHIWISTSLTEDRVIVRVADDGPGIPATIIGSVFEPFITHGKKQGTGLGLATARNLMLAQGGDIAVEAISKEGGAAFTMSIPLLTPSVSEGQNEAVTNLSLDTQ
jgi:signal transduction histidine kinase